MRMSGGVPCAWSRGYHAHVRVATMRMSGGVPCAWSRGYHAHDHGEFWLAYGSDVWYNERKKSFGKEVYVFLDNLISKVSTCIGDVLCTSVPGVFLACACSSPSVTVDVKDTTPPKPRGDELSEALFDNLRAYCRKRDAHDHAPDVHRGINAIHITMQAPCNQFAEGSFHSRNLDFPSHRPRRFTVGGGNTEHLDQPSESGFVAFETYRWTCLNIENKVESLVILKLTTQNRPLFTRLWKSPS